MNSTPLFVAAVQSSFDCVIELLKDTRVDIYKKNIVLFFFLNDVYFGLFF